VVLEGKTKEVKPADYLPNPSLIAEPAKIADIICISEGALHSGRKLKSLVG